MSAYHYRVTVQRLDGPGGVPAADAEPLRFDVTQHDDLAVIAQRVRQRGDLPAADAPAFAVGLKLFGGVMLAHRDLPLFQGLRPHWRSFMQTLKQGPAA